MKKIQTAGLVTAWALILCSPLTAQTADPATPDKKTDGTVKVQPSSDVRYPQAKDIINSQPQAKPLWGTTPTPVTSVPGTKNTDNLEPGWYVTWGVSGSEDEVKAQAPGLPGKLGASTDKRVWMQKDNGQWLLLVGPYTTGESITLLPKLKSLGPGLNLLRY